MKLLFYLTIYLFIVLYKSEGWFLKANNIRIPREEIVFNLRVGESLIIQNKTDRHAS